MGLIGVMKGAGDALGRVGEMGVASTFQDMNAAANAERQKMIAKYSQGLQDESWAGRNETEYGQTEERDKQLHEYKKDEIGATGKAKAKTEGGLKAGEVLVRTQNGPAKWKESDLRGSYDKQYGKFDPMGQLIGFDENAPRYMDWRNGVVEPEFIIGETTPQPKMSWEEARKTAEKEASDKAGLLKSEKEDFGPNGREHWINNRAQELMTGQPVGGTGQPSKFASLWGDGDTQPAQAQPAPKQAKGGGLINTPTPTKGYPLDQLKRREDIAAAEAANKPEAINQQITQDINQGKVDRESGLLAMGERFGIPQDASKPQRGEDYNELAKAVTRVNNDRQKGIVPTREDLQQALIFARGKGDEALQAEVEQLLSMYYPEG